MSDVLRQGLSMLKVVHGNRLEPLAGELMRSLLEVPASPFEVETVVVPSLGVARWLQYRVADVFGVCMQIEFAFAAQFVWQTFARLLDDVPRRSPFDVQVMTLRLYAQLGRLPASEVYAPLRRYIEQAGEQGRIQLAEKLAQVFDRYLVYRPEWVQSWAAGQLCGLTPSSTERWQLGCGVVWSKMPAYVTCSILPKSSPHACATTSPRAGNCRAASDCLRCRHYRHSTCARSPTWRNTPMSNATYSIPAANTGAI